MLYDIVWLVLWCLSVYVCAYDWENGRKLPRNNSEKNSHDGLHVI